MLSVCRLSTSRLSVYTDRCTRPHVQLLEQYTSSLSDGDRQAVRLLVQAAQLMDRLYLTQEWEGLSQAVPVASHRQRSC
jgi:hypothetical protein